MTASQKLGEKMYADMQGSQAAQAPVVQRPQARRLVEHPASPTTTWSMPK